MGADIVALVGNADDLSAQCCVIDFETFLAVVMFCFLM